jgi:hypothetical protein
MDDAKVPSVTTTVTLVCDVRYLALFCITEEARLARDCLFGTLKQHFRGH